MYTDEYDSVWDVPPIDHDKQYSDEIAEKLEQEAEILKTDEKFYLECMNGKPLKDRIETQEKFDGLVLWWVYQRCKK